MSYFTLQMVRQMFSRNQYKVFFVNSRVNIFYVNICRPTHHKSAYNSFSQFGLFGYCHWLINQIPTYVHCGSWSAETNSSYRFRFSLCWSRASFPCSNRHLVIFLPPLTKELDRCSQNALHLYPLLQRIWFQQAMVLQASV